MFHVDSLYIYIYNWKQISTCFSWFHVKPLCLMKLLKDFRSGFFQQSLRSRHFIAAVGVSSLLGTPPWIFNVVFAMVTPVKFGSFLWLLLVPTVVCSYLDGERIIVNVEGFFHMDSSKLLNRTPIWWNVKTNWKPAKCFGFQKTVSTRHCLDQTQILQWLVEVMRITCFASNHTQTKHSVVP